MHLELHRATKVFGRVRALDDVSVVFAPGEVVAVLGANGAGKSTLLRVLSGLLQPDSGDVLYDGQRLRLDDLALRRRLFFLPDFPPVFAAESLLANLGLLLRIYEADDASAPEKVLHAMKALDLLDLAEKPVETLSRGQIYKAALAALLVIDPELWLLDEPLASGMDPQGLAVLRTEVRKAAGRGRTILFTTQILEVAERLADRACVLHKGGLRMSAPIAELRRASSTGTDGVLDALLQGLSDP